MKTGPAQHTTGSAGTHRMYTLARHWSSVPMLPPITADAQSIPTMVCKATFPRESLAANRGSPVAEMPAARTISRGSAWLPAAVLSRVWCGHGSCSQAHPLLFFRVFTENASSPCVTDSSGNLLPPPHKCLCLPLVSSLCLLLINQREALPLHPQRISFHRNLWQQRGAALFGSKSATLTGSYRKVSADPFSAWTHGDVHRSM